MRSQFEGPAINELQAQLRQHMPRQADEAVWRHTALELLFPDDPRLLAMMLDFSRQALAELADIDPERHFADPHRAHNPAPARTYRKLLMACRDTIMLTSGDELSRKAARPLPRLCHQIGLLADGDGQELEHRRKAWRQFDKLGRTLEYVDGLRPVTPQALRQSARHRIHPKRLRMDGSRHSLERLHDARIDFRRVAFAGLVSAICVPQPQKQRYAAEGLRLSGLYGYNHYQVGLSRQQLEGVV